MVSKRSALVLGSNHQVYPSPVPRLVTCPGKFVPWSCSAAHICMGRTSHSTVLFLGSRPVATGGSFPAGICELRWVPASKAWSMHVVNSGKVPGQTGKALLCVAPRTQLDLWPKAQVECGAMKPAINSARPMPYAGTHTGSESLAQPTEYQLQLRQGSCPL